jgi:hypothetical protein
MQAPDIFWGLTATGWTAIGSAISAASVIALVIFNWRFIHFAREQADASVEQAKFARESLKNLQKQIAEEEQRDRHVAIAILGGVLDDLQLWNRRSGTEYRSDNERITLLPDDWGIVLSFLSRRVPELAHDAYAAGRELREAEIELNNWVKIELSRRGGNSSLGVVLQNMLKRLNQAFESIDKLLNRLNEQ